MEAEKMTLEQIQQMNLPPIIVYAIPFMLSFVLIEFIIGAYQKRKLYNKFDFWANVGIGVGNVLSSAATKFLLFGVILFFYNMVPWRVPYTWWSFILCFIVIDFCRWLAHLIAHKSRFFWSTHVVHHSSEEMNFSISFRLSWFQQVKVLFFIPVALMGFHPLVFFITHQIAVLYQFWIHTEIIGRLPKPIEYIFVTPSHHRVHHGSEPENLDKNFGSTLIIWDRIFGTFQPETGKVKYGITKPVNSFNPIYLNFHEIIDIFKDLKYARSFREAMVIMFSKPGDWQRPEEPKAEPVPIAVESNENVIAERLLEKDKAIKEAS